MLPINRSTSPPLRIAILNDDHDRISMLSAWFQLHGHVPLPGRLVELRKEHLRPHEFIHDLGADIVIMDVGVPYAVNWYCAELLQLNSPAQALIVTTVNRTALEGIIGRAGKTFELTGSKENLNDLLRLVYTASGRDENGAMPPVQDVAARRRSGVTR